MFQDIELCAVYTKCILKCILKFYILLGEEFNQRSVIAQILQVYEWLCLNCQTQRALKEMEPLVTKPQAKPDIVTTSTPPRSVTPKTETSAGETSKKELPPVPSDKVISGTDEFKASVTPPVQKEKNSITDTSKVQEAVPNEEKRAEKKEAQVSSERMPAMEDQKAPGPPKVVIDQDTAGQPTDNKEEMARVLEKPDKSTVKSSSQEQDTSKQETGFFGFGFGGTKPQPAPSKPSDTSTGKLFGFGGLTETPPTQSVTAVSGKVLGFGSSIFSSASNLISSAVQDEPSKTPPTTRKGSAASQTSIKSPTPPASPKGSAVSQTSTKTPPTSRKGSEASQASLKMPAGDAEKLAAQKLVENKVDQKSEVMVDGTPETAKLPPSLQPAPKPIQASCPICKVELNVGSTDPPNFNICTDCKNTVCSQCGFDPMPHQTKVRNDLILIPHNINI